jgi:hypothetical protein
MRKLSRIIFTHIPKTAGAIIIYTLWKNFGIHHIDSFKTRRPVLTKEDLKFA